MATGPRAAAQASLFDDDPLTAEGSPPDALAALIRVQVADRPLTKAQREFNRLTARIASLRDQLAQWRAAEDACHQRAAAELIPLKDKLRALQRDTVLWTDAYLGRPPQGERLPKKLRAKLVQLLLILSRELLQDSPDAEVEAAHDRHSAQSHREDQREQADLAAAMLGEALGDDSLFEGEADSVDELMRRASQRLQDKTGDPAEPEALPPGRRPSREDKARAREAQALKEASQSVREVYRRLASSLHPDRESDAAERARKTTLMAQVNEAYGRNDLLALLSVQMAIEQMDADHLAQVSDERLRHYVRVLKEQQQALDQELQMVQMPVLEQMASQLRPGLLSPAQLGRLLDDDIRGVRAALKHLTADSQALRDPATRLGFLRAIEVDDPDQMVDPFEELLLMQALSELASSGGPGAPSGAPRHGRRGKRRR